MNITNIAKNIVIWFDMDGVLARWNERASLEEVSSPGYFISRELENTVRDLIRYLIGLGFDVRILTAVYMNGYAEEEKKEWLKVMGLGDVPVVFVPYGESKFKYVNMDDMNILIDDFKKNLIEWTKNGGYAVKFYNGINNRPRMTFDEDGVGHLIQDSWVGPSIDHRQSYQCMAAMILGLIEVFSKEPKEVA